MVRGLALPFATRLFRKRGTPAGGSNLRRGPSKPGNKGSLDGTRLPWGNRRDQNAVSSVWLLYRRPAKSTPAKCARGIGGGLENKLGWRIYHLARRFTADVFPRFSSSSNSTCWPSLSELRPARSTAEICTNTSLPPPVG